MAPLADASVKVGNIAGNDIERTVSATGKARGFRPFNFFGARENRIRYDTPSLMGARVGLSYNENKGWSVGLTYAGAPAGVKNFTALFASGYRNNPAYDNGSRKRPLGPCPAASSTIRRASTSTGRTTRTAKKMRRASRMSQWGITLGWSGKLNDNGATSIGVGFNRSSDGADGSASQYWLAIVQKIDGAAADVYAGVSFDSGSVTHTSDGSRSIGGRTLHFNATAETETADAQRPVLVRRRRARATRWKAKPTSYPRAQSATNAKSSAKACSTSSSASA